MRLHKTLGTLEEEWGRLSNDEKMFYRVALTGAAKGPPMPNVMRALGFEECLNRLRLAVNALI